VSHVIGLRDVVERSLSRHHGAQGHADLADLIDDLFTRLTVH